MPQCPDLVWPETQPCSGGRCALAEDNSTAICECDDPNTFTGYGDFVFDGRTSCALNINAVRGLWAVLTAFFCVTLINSIVFLLAAKRKRKVQTAVGILSSITAILFIAVGTLRATSFKRTIGRDPAVTALFSLAALASWITLMLYLKLFLAVVQSSAWASVLTTDNTMLSRVRHITNVTLPAFALLVVCATLSPLLMLTCTTSQCMYGIALFHFLGIGFAILVSGFVIRFALIIPLAAEIRAHVVVMDGTSPEMPSESRTQLRKLLYKLDFGIRETPIQVILNFLMTVAFGAFQYLQRLSSYELVVAWASGSFLLSLFLFVIFPVARQTRPSTSTSSSKEVKVVVARGAVE